MGIRCLRTQPATRLSRPSSRSDSAAAVQFDSHAADTSDGSIVKRAASEHMNLAEATPLCGAEFGCFLFCFAASALAWLAAASASFFDLDPLDSGARQHIAVFVPSALENGFKLMFLDHFGFLTGELFGFNLVRQGERRRNLIFCNS